MRYAENIYACLISILVILFAKHIAAFIVWRWENVTNKPLKYPGSYVWLLRLIGGFILLINILLLFGVNWTR